MIVKELETAIGQALKNLGISVNSVKLEHPTDESFGDWSTNVALQSDFQANGFSSAKEVAAALKEQLANILDNQDIAEISVAGPGFINFTLSQRYWLKVADSFANQDLSSLIFPKGRGKKVIVEYSSPNIAKPFTVGHLRSTIIGDAIANLYEALGWTVYRDNHLGDWGTQFGKLIYAIKTWGDEEIIDKSAQPVKELVELYIKFHQEAKDDPKLEEHGREWFRKLEAGNAEAKRLWQWCVDLSWKEFGKIYQELGIVFTENNGRGYGESYFEQQMDEVIEILENQLPKEQVTQNGGYYGEGKDGAKLVFFADDSLPSLMILKKDGATLYSTRDLATDYFRLRHYDHPDLVINEVGAEQSLYFQQLYQTEVMLGWYQPEQRVHVKHGLYRFKEGKMSTRKGNVVWLEEVLAEARRRAKKLAKKPGADVGVVAMGALKWNDLRSETKRDIVFDWNDILSMKGNSGPYVQYAAVRAKSVIDKASDDLSAKIDPNYTLNAEELAIIRWLAKFEEVIQQAAEEFSPHHLALFLFELAQRFNVFYNKHPILTADESVTRQSRLAITAASHKTLVFGLKLLGIETPEEM